MLLVHRGRRGEAQPASRTREGRERTVTHTSTEKGKAEQQTERDGSVGAARVRTGLGALAALVEVVELARLLVGTPPRGRGGLTAGLESALVLARRPVDRGRRGSRRGRRGDRGWGGLSGRRCLGRSRGGRDQVDGGLCGCRRARVCRRARGRSASGTAKRDEKTDLGTEA